MARNATIAVALELRLALQRCRASGLHAEHAVNAEGVMGLLGELLSADHRQALEFFFLGLKDLSEPTVDHQELLYNASVLAHFAQVSTRADVDVPTPVNLSAVFDSFVADPTLQQDSLMMETAGAQLLAGFFEDQMRRRHSIRWYSALGAGFFGRAAAQEQSQHKARLLDSMARNFEPWRQRHAELSRELRDQPYLLAPPVNPVRRSG
jgi:hypothetical protein